MCRLGVQLQQVILNLIRNAVEATSSVPESSRVLTLKTEIEDAQHIQITVGESGPGIDPKDIERIFERLFTTKAHGMGTIRQSPPCKRGPELICSV